MVRFCSNCRKIHPITTKKCPICGLADLPRFCTTCRKFVPDGAASCPTCGDPDPTREIQTQRTSSKQGHKPNKKAAITMFLTIVAIFGVAIIWKLFLNPCRNGHTWKNATCTEPRTCDVCGETEGYSLGHDWEGATCTTPGICSRCGEEGYTASHKYLHGICEICGEEEVFYTVTEDNDDNYWYAVTAAQDLVKDELKLPSTAEFPLSTDGYSVKRAFLENDWIVSGYVDAQNILGSTKREYWTATFTMGSTSGKTYKVSNYQVIFQ